MEYYLVGVSFILSTAILWILIYNAILRIEHGHPDLYKKLEKPKLNELLSRLPMHWRKQIKFLKFVFSRTPFNQGDKRLAQVVLGIYASIGAFFAVIALIALFAPA